MPQTKYFYVIALGSLFALAGCGQETSAPAPAAPAGSAAPMSAEQPHPMPTAEVADVDLSGIETPEGGVTIAELYAGKAELAGQTVTVRGKVVKVNADIMGRNWVHLRDGSGAEGTNNLAVTTNQLPNVGDTVLVTGTLESDKDFGMGYTYELIIEQPELTVEGYGDQ
ncbi:OB-fold nucleic acid binding domain-containing protein [Thioalkalivibrio sp. XN8]|uniref:OB-fold nucleic acid binding domain-containing protein n=1 Tax=Thioalkalivibrio sp. XN8 TaxID=2712863 RepID=UPI0013ECDF66|nr:OB-fold nucleic acid binding domain-containing protein [Thioalkalivibrio sp. XN8]NGP53393.1 nucleotide-binding protein [Thioalkalivibrio sp. XN8]